MGACEGGVLHNVRYLLCARQKEIKSLLVSRETKGSPGDISDSSAEASQINKICLFLCSALLVAT